MTVDATAPRVSIIILVLERTQRLRTCLESLTATAPSGVSTEVIVVANGTPDSEMRGIEREGVTVLRSAVNIGFAAGCNLAARHARGELLILLNDDTEVETGWLTALLAAADADERIGAVGSRLLNADGSVQEVSAMVWGDGGTAQITEDPAHDATGAVIEVDYCSGAAMLVRQSAWRAVGGMDEFFSPGYYEDVDFCWALRAADRRVVTTPAARVLHHRSGSTSRPMRDFISERNRRRFLFKWSDELAQRGERPPDRSSAAPRWGERYARRKIQSPRWNLPALIGNAPGSTAGDAARQSLRPTIEARDLYLDSLERENADLRSAMALHRCSRTLLRGVCARIPFAQRFRHHQ